MRQYLSPFREAKRAQTRARVLQAAEALLAQGSAELEVPAIARAAGVSTATVYQHFPNREALMDGVLQHLQSRMGAAPRPTTPEEALHQARARARWFLEHETTARALVACPPLREAVARHRRPRVERGMAALTEHLPQGRARAVQGLLVQLGDPLTLLALKDQWGAEDEDILAAVGWAMGVLVERLQARGESP